MKRFWSGEGVGLPFSSDPTGRERATGATFIALIVVSYALASLLPFATAVVETSRRLSVATEARNRRKVKTRLMEEGPSARKQLVVGALWAAASVCGMLRLSQNKKHKEVGGLKS